eukprot:TRINITY_DN14593_c0_g1_i1.p1 TRINITY_DN14593_c0_g1~~TRINITY_DN14593_c0_g1_i1.p1  ORF type:complete len:215 (-),score=52.22 TRINITY_DN14593_c0_g1_i1:137-781(-)
MNNTIFVLLFCFIAITVASHEQDRFYDCGLKGLKIASFSHVGDEIANPNLYISNYESPYVNAKNLILDSLLVEGVELNSFNDVQITLNIDDTFIGTSIIYLTPPNTSTSVPLVSGIPGNCGSSDDFKGIFTPLATNSFDCSKASGEYKYYRPANSFDFLLEHNYDPNGSWKIGVVETLGSSGGFDLILRGWEMAFLACKIHSVPENNKSGRNGL